jgi:hypothetical protein
VADVASCASRASVDAAIHDDTAANAGAGLDEQAVVNPRPEAPVLAQRHQIYVVVGEDIEGKLFREHTADVDIVPGPHHRGTDDAAGAVVDRGRQAKADAQDAARRQSRPGKERACRAGDLRQDRRWSAADVDRAGCFC